MKQDWTESLRNKMEGYSETPSDGVWEGVASRTVISTSGGSRRILPVWLYATMGAAAVLAGALLIVRHGEPAPVDGNIAVAVSESSSAISEEIQPVLETATVQEPRILVADASSSVKMSEPVAYSAGPELPVQEDSVPPVETAVESYRPDQPAEVEEVTDYEAEKEAWARIMEEERKKTGRGHHIGLALSASGAGKSTNSSSARSDLVLGSNPMNGLAGTPQISPSIIENQGGLNFNQPEVPTEYSHKIPVKMGLAVRYGFGRFGIETGLTYSILSSDLKVGEEGLNWSKGTQTLHYIGIPLNLSFDIVDKRFFTMYVTAGGMGEKSVKGRRRTDEYENGTYVRSTSSGVRPKEIQWSVNAAAGFQVNILRQLGLFVEPGVSHRFATESKIRSVYTDKPTDFSLGFGLRYDFR